MFFNKPLLLFLYIRLTEQATSVTNKMKQLSCQFPIQQLDEMKILHPLLPDQIPLNLSVQTQIPKRLLFPPRSTLPGLYR